MNPVRLRPISLCVVLSCAASLGFAQTRQADHSAVARKPKNEALRQELIKMLEADQAVRAPFTQGRMPTESEVRKAKELDAADTKRLLEIFRQYGFPDASLVGRDGVGAVATMILHSPSLELKRKSLPYFKKAARRGEIPPDDVANLTDIILHDHLHKPQLYGTRFDIEGGRLVLKNVKDPAHLEERRRKLGLMPFSEYVRELGEMSKMPVDTSIIPR
jgi:hypothetical protein